MMGSDRRLLGALAALRSDVEPRNHDSARHVRVQRTFRFKGITGLGDATTLLFNLGLFVLYVVYVYFKIAIYCVFNLL